MTKVEILIVCVIVSILTAVVLPNFLEPLRPYHPSSGSDMRSLATAIESYFIEHRTYPATVPLSVFTTEKEKLAKANGSRVTGIFPGSSHATGITTPVAYVKSLY